MPTTPNAQLTKLAIGIASVAAVAGISGKIAAQPPAAGQAQTTTVATAGNRATNTNTAVGGPSAAPADGAQQYQSPVFSGFGDDEEEGESGEHEGSRSFFGTAPAQPQSGRSGTFTQQAPQQQTRRTRSKHS